MKKNKTSQKQRKSSTKRAQKGNIRKKKVSKLQIRKKELALKEKKERQRAQEEEMMKIMDSRNSMN